MPRFKKKSEIVDAYEIPARDLWVVKNNDGTEIQYLGNTFRRLFERVGDECKSDLQAPVWDGTERRSTLVNMRCPHCGMLISRQCLICPTCKQNV